MKAANKTVTTGLITLFVFTITAFFYLSGFFTRFEYIAYDQTVQLIRSDKQISDEIAVVLIDEASLKALNPLIGRWPWRRAIYSDLFEFLSMGKPKAILMDILFTETQGSSSKALVQDDLQLAAATRSAGNVYHSIQLVNDKEDEINKTLLNRPMPNDFIERFAIKSINSDMEIEPTNNYYIPFKELYDASYGIGVVDFTPDMDGVFRRTRIMQKYQDKFFYVMGLAPLVGDLPVKVEEQAIKVGNKIFPLDKGGKYALNMYGKFNTYSISGLFASLQKIIEGDFENLIVSPNEFAGKIVFIGASAVGVEDLKATPISTKTPGVFLHATLASNYILDDFLKPSKPVVTLVLTLLLTLIAIPGIMYIKHFRGKILLPVVLLTLWTVFYLHQFSENRLYEFIPPFFALALSSISSFGYLVLTEGREKLKVRKMFSQYVSPEVLSTLTQQHDEYARSHVGSKEDVTVLFTDIRNFTSLTEKTKPEKVVEMLNCYFSHMTEVIFQNGGTVDKFIGDAIMVFWGAPIKTSDHANKAVTAAMEMADRLSQVNIELIERGLEGCEIKTGIGISTGDVIIGSIGSERKLDYTVIGDTVNLASRLEGLTKEYGVKVIISEYTYERLNNDYPCRPIDSVRVKGKQEEVKVYEPIGYSDKESFQEASKLCELTKNAYEYYIKGEYSKAIELYKKIEDGLLKETYLKRCNEKLKAQDV